MPGRGDDGAALLHRGRDRLLDQHMHASLDAAERDVLMQVGRGGDGDGIDACRQQRLNAAELRAAQRPGNEIALLASGSATPTSLTPGKSASTRAWLLPMTPTPTTPTRSGRPASRLAACTMMDQVPPAGWRDESPSTPEGRWRCPRSGLWTRFESKSYMPDGRVGMFHDVTFGETAAASRRSDECPRRSAC